jgi:hypothetical protein
MGLGSGIRKKTYSGSRIWVQGSKSQRIPDPDPQHWNQELKTFKYHVTVPKLS